MTILRSFWVLALVAAAACTPQNKYPHAPQFASPETVPARSIAVPPAARSDRWKMEISSIIEKQKHLTDAEITAMRAEMPVKPEMIVLPVLGENITREAYPALYSLLIKTGSDAWRIGDSAKKYWGTTRPWLSDKRVQLKIDPIRSNAYPSGHTTTGHVWAAVLSEVIPAAKKASFNRAHDIAHHRILAGVHYPHDIQGGKDLAQNIVQQFHRAPHYHAALKAAQKELEQKRYRFRHTQ